MERHEDANDMPGKVAEFEEYPRLFVMDRGKLIELLSRPLLEAQHRSVKRAPAHDSPYRAIQQPAQQTRQRKKKKTRETHEMERHEDANDMPGKVAEFGEYPRLFVMDRGKLIELLSRPLLEAQHRSVKRAPENESPCRAMPKPAKEHRQEEITIARDLTMAITAKRNIE